MTTKLHRLSIALAAGAAGAALLITSAGAQTGPTTLHLSSKQQRGVGFQPAGPPSQGSRLGFGDRISGDDTGYGRSVCTFMAKSGGLLCTIQLHLSKGTITAQGEIPQRAQNTRRDHRRHRRV